jgi:hypothetical protein
MNNLNDLINETNENDLVIVNIEPSNSINNNNNDNQTSHTNIYWNDQSTLSFLRCVFFFKC